ncbi:response regulator transcription factor [Streptosporangium sp. KLBMP 9127]|nr:response regulator transcription factor [Streptosporangium sp. KLBMP 9127]
MISVVIADDHPVVRQGLRTFLDLQDDVTVVGEAADGAEAVELVASLAPDLLLLDLKMPVLDGRATLARLAARGLAVRVLVLTSVSDRGDVAPAMRAGAVGFLYKDIDPGALVAAIRAVADGQVLLAPEAAEAMLAVPLPVAGPLTDREREVLKLIAAGRSNREIARDLSVAEKTVKTHVSNVLMKLGVQDRTQAALYAVRHDLA